jgi:hypothetical protein
MHARPMLERGTNIRQSMDYPRVDASDKRRGEGPKEWQWVVRAWRDFSSTYDGELAVGLFDLVLRRILGDPEELRRDAASFRARKRVCGWRLDACRGDGEQGDAHARPPPPCSTFSPARLDARGGPG